MTETNQHQTGINESMHGRFNRLLAYVGLGGVIGEGKTADGGQTGDFKLSAILRAEGERDDDLPESVRRMIGMGTTAVKGFKDGDEPTDEELMALVEAHNAGLVTDVSEYFDVKTRLATTFGWVKWKGSKEEEFVHARLKTRPIDSEAEASDSTRELVVQVVSGPNKNLTYPVVYIHKGEITVFDGQPGEQSNTYPTVKADSNIFAVVPQRNGKINIYRPAGSEDV